MPNYYQVIARAELAALRAQHDALAAALRSALWIADCAIDADINGRKPAGCIRDGITHRMTKIRAALATLETAEGGK